VAEIRWAAAGPLLLLALVIMGSPGPASISLVAAGSALGVRRSLRYLAGVVAGTTVVLVLVASGIMAALLEVPAMGPVLRWASAAYLLWLAYHIATAPPLTEPAPAPPPRAFSLARGAVLGAANPKGWVAIAAVFASAHLAGEGTTDAAAKVAVLAPTIVVICTAWLVAGTSIAPLLHEPRRARLVNVALAVALVGATALAVFR
jgi:threonine/homoserine/homoserine lactone efflux protein